MFQGINILKAHGKSAKDSYLLNGYALNSGRAAQGMPIRVAPARIACLDFNLQKTKMQLGVQVLVSDPRELEKIRQRYLIALKLLLSMMHPEVLLSRIMVFLFLKISSLPFLFGIFTRYSICLSFRNLLSSLFY